MRLTLIRRGVGTLLYDSADLANSPAILLSMDGLGMAPVERQRQRGAMQHGETDFGFRLRPRTFSLVFLLVGMTLAELQTRREWLIGQFGPDPLENEYGLWFELENGDQRRIDCSYSGEMGMGSDDQHGYALRVAVQFSASDPTLYDPRMESISFALPPGGAGLAVPVPFPFTLTTSALTQSRVVENAGNWISLPAVRIDGPISNPKLLNVTTGEFLHFAGYSVSADEYYMIDCAFGKKTVLAYHKTTNALQGNRYYQLSSDSHLATFHLVPGPNEIRLEGTGLSSETNVRLQFYRRYLGM